MSALGESCHCATQGSAATGGGLDFHHYASVSDQTDAVAPKSMVPSLIGQLLQLRWPAMSLWAQVTARFRMITEGTHQILMVLGLIGGFLLGIYILPELANL